MKPSNMRGSKARVHLAKQAHPPVSGHGQVSGFTGFSKLLKARPQAANHLLSFMFNLLISVDYILIYSYIS